MHVSQAITLGPGRGAQKVYAAPAYVSKIMKHLIILSVMALVPTYLEENKVHLVAYSLRVMKSLAELITISFDRLLSMTGYRVKKGKKECFRVSTLPGIYLHNQVFTSLKILPDMGRRLTKSVTFAALSKP